MPTPDALPEQVATTRRFSLGVPRAITVGADGRTVLFLRTRAGDDPVACLWATDADTGAERLLADPAGLLEPPDDAGRSGDGIRAYATDRAGRLAVFTFAGSLWAVDVADGRVRRLPASGEPAAPRPDPQGRRIAYATGGALRLIGADGRGDRELAAPQGPEVVHGLGEHTEHGLWWAPDGRRLLYARTDFTRVGRWYLADPSAPWQPPRVLRRSTPGTPLPDVTLWVAELAASARMGAARTGSGAAGAGAAEAPAESPAEAHAEPLVSPHAESPARPRAESPSHADAEPLAQLRGGLRTPPDAAPFAPPRIQVLWDRAAFAYVVGAGWDAHGPYALVQSRDQRTVRLLAIDPADGTTRVLHEQHDPRWVHLVPGLPARTAAGELVTAEERDGTRTLAVAGTPVTPAGLQLGAVLGVEGEDVLFTASREPAETHLWTYRPGEGLRRLSREPGVHTGVRGGGTLVHTAGGPDRPGGRTTVRRRGSTRAIASLVQQPTLDVRAVRLLLGPRRLRADLHLPSWHRPGTRLPVLADPYGGAARRRVTAERDWRSLVAQWFAEQGFAVLVADGRGTPGRGPQWERAVHGDLFGPAVEDQATAVREAARRFPDLDPGRVGIRGWSFGGALALAAVLQRPDVFHAAVAGAAVTDQRVYDARWRERFLGPPAESLRTYESNSLLRRAPSLTRPLLLVQGLADTTTHPSHTLRMSAALLAAARPHEVLLLPNAGHDAIGSPLTAPLLRHQLAFLQKHLHPPSRNQAYGGAD